MMGAPNAMGPPAVTPRKAPTTPSHNAHSAFAFGVTPHKTPLRTPGGSKIEQTSSTPIIDFNAIESQKENVQPLAKGRSAHALSNTLNMQHKQRQALLAQQRAHHEQLVTSQDNADSDDPLEAWTKYVKWCIDNYPSGQTHESGLIPLLERATRYFKDWEQYTNDSRYLRLWILYARNVECARDVYNFLLANEIGTKLASLYEELAVVLEGQRMYDEADAMYKLGIARRVNPIDRIKRRYEEYKTRIILGQQAMAESSGSSTSAIVSNYADALKSAMATVGRSMLGEKEVSAGPARSHSANVLRGAGASVGAIGANTSTPSNNNGRKLNVFHDEDDEHVPRSKPQAASTKGWEDIGTVASRNQENFQADRLSGINNFKIGASGGVSKKPGSGLAVFRDSDDDDDDEGEEVPSTPKPAGVLSPKDHLVRSASGLGRKAQSSETDLLRSNPFAYWGKDAKLVPDPASLRPAATDSHSSRKVSSSSTGSNGEKHRTKTTISRSAQPGTSSGVPASNAAASAAAGGKREKHAAPVGQMYPDFRSSTQKAFYKQRGWHNELTLEELMARKRGFAAVPEDWQDASEKGIADPWPYLDQLAGRWLPEDPVPAAPASKSPFEVEPTQTVNIDQTTGMFPSRDVFDPDNSVANAVALNLRPGAKKKKREGENTTTAKHRMSPTLVTKAAVLEVESMHGHKGVNLGSSADVPPTPTPLSRSNHLPKLGVQNDENAGVQATPLRTPGGQAPRLGLGGATPMRTPLALKSALATLGSKPVYREEDEDEEEQEELPKVDEEPAEVVSAAASPERVSARSEEAVAAAPNGEPIEGQVAGYEGNEHLFRPQFQPLTPITEATYEFTRYTNARTPGTATRSAIGPALKSWRPSGQGDEGEDDDDDEEDSPGAILAAGPIAAAVRHEDDSQRYADDSQPSDERSFASTSGEDANRSAWNADNKASFELTKGLTIKCAAPEDDEEDDGEFEQERREMHERFEESFVMQESEQEEFDPPNPCSPVDPAVLSAILARLEVPIESMPGFVSLAGSSSGDLVADLQKRCKSSLASNQMTRKSMGGTTVARSIVSARKLYCYADTSFLLLDLGEKGTLLDVVNHSISAGVAGSGADSSSGGGAGLEEVLAMFFITELVRVVIDMHRAGIIHGDLKIDNCLLRLGDVSPASSWSNIYSRDGSSGWSEKGVLLIDFGRAIDLHSYPNRTQTFIADWETDTKDCFEMRANQPFTYETDYFGIATVAHCLLFGRYMDTKHDPATGHKVTSTFKRYWQTQLWSTLFDVCLNPPKGEAGAVDRDQVLTLLEGCLSEMQGWLEANSNKGGKNLKGMLRKLEIWAMKQSH
ncbi:hypothetical protein [Sporisorium scitamineum]|uniref:Spindle assembly checkpoint protein n=1 Tax=Sporisorium scitamineum TaxID=49012 RepID=A0A0F7S4D3_9BASI|nr:hypothetical protein [Sporisorium scitamineum]